MVVKKQFIAEETLKGREERCGSWVFVLFCFLFFPLAVLFIT